MSQELTVIFKKHALELPDPQDYIAIGVALGRFGPLAVAVKRQDDATPVFGRAEFTDEGVCVNVGTDERDVVPYAQVQWIIIGNEAYDFREEYRRLSREWASRRVAKATSSESNFAPPGEWPTHSINSNRAIPSGAPADWVTRLGGPLDDT